MPALPPLPWRYQMWQQRKARRLLLVSMALALAIYALVVFSQAAYSHDLLPKEGLMLCLWAALPLGLALLVLLRRAVVLSRSEEKTPVKEVSCESQPPESWFALRRCVGLEITPLAGPDGVPPPVAPTEPPPVSPRARPWFLASALLLALFFFGFVGQIGFLLPHGRFPFALPAAWRDFHTAALELVFLAAFAAQFAGIYLDPAGEKDWPVYSGQFDRFLALFAAMLLFLLPGVFFSDPLYLGLVLGLFVLAWTLGLGRSGFGEAMVPLPKEVGFSRRASPRARPYLRIAVALMGFNSLAVLSLLVDHFSGGGEGFFAGALLFSSPALGLAWARGTYLDALDKGCPPRAVPYFVASGATHALMLPLFVLCFFFWPLDWPTAPIFGLAAAFLFAMIGSLAVGQHLARAGMKGA